MEQFLNYYLTIFSKPLGEITIFEILSVLALPFAGILGLALIGVVIGQAIEIVEGIQYRVTDKSIPPWKRWAHTAVLAFIALLIALFFFVLS